MEADFKKSLEITGVMMKHSRELFNKNSDLTTAFDALKVEVQDLRDE